MAVTESKGDGYSLFNGIKLPSLPEWDKEQYPYVAVLTDESGNYYFHAKSSAITYSAQGVGVISNQINSGAVIMLAFSSVEWIPHKQPEEVARVYYNAVWGNHDIIKTTDDSIYLAGSAPISLDGMNVIEWDGDTTGLENVYGMQYKVSDTILRKGDFTNSVVVMTYTDGAQVTQGDTVFEAEGMVAPAIGGEPINGVIFLYVEDEQFGMSTGLWFGNTEGVAYTSLFAYTPVGGDTPEPEEPEEPDIPEPPAPEPEPEEPEEPTKVITDPESFLIGYQIGCRMRMQRGARKPIGYE